VNQISHYAGARLPAISEALSLAASGSNVSFFGKRETAQEREARLRRGDDAPGMVIAAGPRVPPSGSVIEEAKRILPELERAMQPMPEDLLEDAVSRFLDTLNAAVANPQDEDALTMRKIALAAGCEGFPAMVWSRGAMKLAIQRFKFFPAASEVIALLNDQIGPMRDRLAQIRIVARQTPREETATRRTPTAEERAAVAARAAAFRDEINAREAEERAEREIAAMLPDVSLRGEAMIAALEDAMPNMAPPLQAVARAQIAMHRKALELAAAFTGEITEKTA